MSSGNISETYKIKDGKKLRYGYTTGTCAAAAAKAAVMILYGQDAVESISIDTPKGWTVEIPVIDIDKKPDTAYCCVIKDAGDDPDITDGIRVCAKAVKSKTGVTIKAGEGIGTVTKKGLAVDVGKPAINPVPMRMITDSVNRVLPANSGAGIEISVPGGEEIAAKTFNPKLGIKGGISIIGTSGIVEPMSDDSIKDSIALEISVLKKSGKDSAVFVPGNYGYKFAKEELKIDPEKIISVSNYIGEMLEQAVFYKMKEILLVGHIGKLVKTAGGIFNTHSKFADARMEILASHYALYSEDYKSIEKIMQSNTTEEAIDYIKENAFYQYLAQKISHRCSEFIHQSVKIETVLFSEKRGLLGKSKEADDMIERLRSLS